MNLRTKPLDMILAAAEKKGLKRQLGWFELTMLGIGAVIGTGIFVLTAVAANKAGPGMMISFVIAGSVCVLTALIYAEIASMVPYRQGRTAAFQRIDDIGDAQLSHGRAPDRRSARASRCL